VGIASNEHCGHGFRTTFSTLAREVLDYPDRIVEASLAHVTSGVEGIYNKARFFEKRRELMQAWADYLDELRDDVPMTRTR
jgi:integrase